MNPLGAFGARYGGTPLHMLSMVSCLALAGYVALKLISHPSAVSIAIWFVGAAVAHDFVLFPFYSALNRLADRPGRTDHRTVRWINYLRFPALASGTALLVYAPLILGLSGAQYEIITGLDTSLYLKRWLLVTGLLFASSGAILALRLGRGGHDPVSSSRKH